MTKLTNQAIYNIAVALVILYIAILAAVRDTDAQEIRQQQEDFRRGFCSMVVGTAIPEVRDYCGFDR